MAAISKPVPTETDTATIYPQESLDFQHLNYDKEGLTSPSSMPTVPLSTTARLSGTYSSVPSAHTIINRAGSLIVGDHHVDHQHDSSPCDGDTVWYCSDCGNGPMGYWYTACPVCNHHRCVNCTVEHVPGED